jgi:hypothetical protein
MRTRCMLIAVLLFAGASHVPRLGTFTADGQTQHGFHVSLRQFPSVSQDLHKRVRSLSKGILLGKTTGKIDQSDSSSYPR